MAKLAARIEAESLRLIETVSYAEHCDPITGAPCDGGQFTWTAAMVVGLLSRSEGAA